MLLRTSSAPMAHGLFLHSPDRDADAGITSCSRFTGSQDHSTNKVSFGHGLQHLCSVSCHNCSSNNLSQKGPTVWRKMIRRAQSDGNLEGLGVSSCSDLEGVYSSIMVMSKSLNDLQKAILEAEPSFSIYGAEDKLVEAAGDDSLEGKKDTETSLERTVTIGEGIGSQFCFGWNAMQIIKEDDNEEEAEEEDEDNEGNNQFKGLTVDLSSVSSGVTTKTDLESNSSADLDKYYKKMLSEDPSNPLILRNYGEFLESKKDFSGAEDQYCRAVLADPNDGEILTRYAKLLWEVNGDQARASTYFNRAAIFSTQDSNVLAAYANFMWNTDEGDEEVEVYKKPVQVIKDEERPPSPPLHLAMGLGLSTPDIASAANKHDYLNLYSGDNDTIEEYSKRMIEENPCNALFLGDCSRFLHQKKGDLRGAAEYYSRAILEDPSDGQTLYLYADVIWQLYLDHDRAASYYERAIQASPNDCNVLAAYAKFLWDSEPEEDAVEQAAPCLVPVPVATAGVING